ncbi:MAG: hypothetical protein QXR09_00560 [Candidatus Aenigmatarchaeota archaeon]
MNTSTKGLKLDNIEFDNKILLIFILFLFLFPLVKACITTDYHFTLNIGDLKINQEKLESLCDEKSCYVTEEFTVLKSSYDERVAIIIGKTSSILGFKGITFKLPYTLNEENMPTISEVDPEKYDWKILVKNDLNFLKKLGVLEISPEEIEEISNLAENGKNIVFCNSKWQALEPNCYCSLNEITGENFVCVRCSAPAFNIKLPESLLSLKENSESENLKLSRILVFVVIIVLVVIVYKIKVKKVL